MLTQNTYFLYTTFMSTGAKERQMRFVLTNVYVNIDRLTFDNT